MKERGWGSGHEARRKAAVVLKIDAGNDAAYPQMGWGGGGERWGVPNRCVGGKAKLVAGKCRRGCRGSTKKSDRTQKKKRGREKKERETLLKTGPYWEATADRR